MSGKAKGRLFDSEPYRKMLLDLFFESVSPKILANKIVSEINSILKRGGEICSQPTTPALCQLLQTCMYLLVLEITEPVKHLWQTGTPTVVKKKIKPVYSNCVEGKAKQAARTPVFFRLLIQCKRILDILQEH